MTVLLVALVALSAILFEASSQHYDDLIKLKEVREADLYDFGLDMFLLGVVIVVIVEVIRLF